MKRRGEICEGKKINKIVKKLKEKEKENEIRVCIYII